MAIRLAFKNGKSSSTFGSVTHQSKDCAIAEAHSMAKKAKDAPHAFEDDLRKRVSDRLSASSEWHQKNAQADVQGRGRSL